MGLLEDRHFLAQAGGAGPLFGEGSRRYCLYGHGDPPGVIEMVHRERVRRYRLCINNINNLSHVFPFQRRPGGL
jgi:hypothetical protein